MIQTLDDWHRMLWALAHCWRAVDGGAHDRVDTLEALQAGTLPEVVMDCAAALGIAKRRQLVWVKNPYIKNPPTFEHVKGATSRLLQEDDGTWTADYVNVMVKGHLDRDGAVEHLERLLGRSH